MLTSTTVFLLYIALGSGRYLRQDTVRTLDCGEVLQTGNVYYLPTSDCEVTLKNKPEKIMVLEFWSSKQFNFSNYCKTLKLVDEDEETIDVCKTNHHTLLGSKYTLSRIDDSIPLEVGVSYVNRNYECPGRVPHEILGTEFNITNAIGGSCPIVIYSKGRLHCELMKKDFGTEEVTIEVRQGRHIKRAAMSTGAITMKVGESITTQVYCGVHILVLNGPPATIQCSVQEPTSKENDDNAVKQLTRCPI